MGSQESDTIEQLNLQCQYGLMDFYFSLWVYNAIILLFILLFKLLQLQLWLLEAPSG